MKKWIQKANIKKGKLHKELGISLKKRIPKATLKKAAKSKGKLGKRARLALNLENMHKRFK